MSKTNLAYDADLKEQVSHVEYDAHHPVDLHDAALAGHMATDERGNPLVDIDEVAGKKLARKVSSWIGTSPGHGAHRFFRRSICISCPLSPCNTYSPSSTEQISVTPD